MSNREFLTVHVTCLSLVINLHVVCFIKNFLFSFLQEKEEDELWGNSFF